MKNSRVSKAVLNRLPKYYRILKSLKEQNISKVSSLTLASMLDLTPSQVRQDFNCFGEFGQQGYGYNVDYLLSEISAILGINNIKKLILIGAGDLGSTLVSHLNFESMGYSLIGIFDKKEPLIGKMVKNTPVRSIALLDEFCLEQRPDAAMLCLTESGAKEIFEALVKRGVKGFINFTNCELKSDSEDIFVENIYLSDSFLSLSMKYKA